MINSLKIYTLTLAVSVGSENYDPGLPKINGGGDQASRLIQIAIGVLAALAVLMIVIAGFRFVTSQGNPQETAKARSTMVYAVAGLLLAIVAQSIVIFAIGKVK